MVLTSLLFNVQRLGSCILCSSATEVKLILNNAFGVGVVPCVSEALPVAAVSGAGYLVQQCPLAPAPPPSTH